MFRVFPLLGVVVAFAFSGSVAGFVAGCDAGDTPRAGTVDPGKPGTVYGPKMGGPLTLGAAGETVQVLGTAAAVSRDGTLHLFMIPDTLPSVSRAYLSVWLPGATWTPQTITGQTEHAGAKIGFLTLDGRDFRLDLEPSAPRDGSRDFELLISRVTISDDGSHYYLTGTLKATLRSTSAGGSSIPLSFTINVP